MPEAGDMGCTRSASGVRFDTLWGPKRQPVAHAGCHRRATHARARSHPVVSQCVMKSRVQLDIIRYIYTFQSVFESSSSQTECFSLPIHSDSCNMGLRLCDSSIVAETLRLTAAKLLLEKNGQETAARAPAVGFNSGSADTGHMRVGHRA